MRCCSTPVAALPPGVHASADGANVATPVSLVEWFLNFYEEACEGEVRPVEGVVRAGEVLFVPRGWWHMAVNLEVRLLHFACPPAPGWHVSLPPAAVG